MTMEEAFFKAIAARPGAPVAAKVKRSLRRLPTGSRGDGLNARAPRSASSGYEWEKLGRRWADFRLGGCSWVGPAEALRGTWWGLLIPHLSSYCATGDVSQGLSELAAGLGLNGRPLDRRARSYLMSVLGSTPANAAELCTVPGIRWFSPLTLLVEAVHDLAGHSVAERWDLRTCLANRVCGSDPAPGAAAIRQLCTLLAEWLAGSSD